MQGLKAGTNGLTGPGCGSGPTLKPNFVQNVGSFFSTFTVVMKSGKHYLQISMNKVPCYYVHSVRIIALLPANGTM